MTTIATGGGARVLRQQAAATPLAQTSRVHRTDGDHEEAAPTLGGAAFAILILTPRKERKYSS
jgi:hypothetical protein